MGASGNRTSVVNLPSRPRVAIWSSPRNAIGAAVKHSARAFEQMPANALSSCDTKEIHPRRVNVCQFKEDNNHVVYQTRTRRDVPRS